MINLMIGPSGAGKGYEACVYHILTALKRGRKVITNMPLDLEKWALLDPTYPDLIEFRKRALPILGLWRPTREEGAFLVLDGFEKEPDETARPFAGVWDYYTTWRHPETKQGPLFVIDEAQNVIPYGATDVQVEEWTALHRHFVCDVLYMTQSLGKVSRTVRDNVQVLYRLRKKIAWGQPDRYIRKVQDGCRGEVMNVTERKYEPRFFGLWRSQTQGASADEFNADDVRPLWKHWSAIGAMICLGLVVTMGASGQLKNPFAMSSHAAVKPQAEMVTLTFDAQGNAVVPDPVPVSPVIETQEPDPDATHEDRAEYVIKAGPFSGMGLHVAGWLKMGDAVSYLVVLSQNGQRVRSFGHAELIAAGYDVTPVSECVAIVTWIDESRYIRCDAPTQTVAFGGS